MSSQSLTRRHLLKRSGLAAGGLAAATALPGAIGRQFVPRAAAQDQPLPAAGPVNVAIWSYRPDIVQDNLKVWAELNGQPAATLTAIPGDYDYENILSSKFLGGEKIDMCYSLQDYVNRYHRAGWIRDDIEQFPWVQEMKAKLQPWGIENMSSLDGKLIGLPYWAGTKYFMYNELHFEKAGISAAPTTWEEFEDQCKQLQGVGVANPYIPGWVKIFGQIGWSMFIESYSEGDYIFDDQNNLTVTGGDTPFRTMLERWKRFYDTGIVPNDVFTIADLTVRFSTGDHSFLLAADYNHKRLNDAEVSAIGGHVRNMINPGSTRETAPISPMIVFGKNVDTPIEVQGDLAHFFGTAYTDGEYHVSKRWVIEEGLGSLDTELMSMPDVRASFAEWRDVDLYDQQMALGKPRNVAKQLWYPDWENGTLGLLQEFILGNMDIGEVLTGMQEKLDQVKNLYPSF